MELATDIMAIFGWACLGLIIPVLVEVRSGQCTCNIITCLWALLSFGLIAASIVLS